MKLLKENYGESEELNTFVAQANARFNTYYTVTLEINGQTSDKYFAFESAAKEYYDGLKKEAEDKKDYYDGASIELNKVDVNLDFDELESTYIDSSEENYDIDDTFDSEEETDLIDTDTDTIEGE